GTVRSPVDDYEQSGAGGAGTCDRLPPRRAPPGEEGSAEHERHEHEADEPGLLEEADLQAVGITQVLLVGTLFEPLHSEVVDADTRNGVLLEEPQADAPDLVSPGAAEAADEVRSVGFRDVLVRLEPIPPDLGLGHRVAVMVDEEPAGAEADRHDCDHRRA